MKNKSVLIRISTDTHKLIKALAKKEKRTLKATLEIAVYKLAQERIIK